VYFEWAGRCYVRIFHLCTVLGTIPCFSGLLSGPIRSSNEQDQNLLVEKPSNKVLTLFLAGLARNHFLISSLDSDRKMALYFLSSALYRSHRDISN
jgi:hypothetical protein